MKKQVGFVFHEDYLNHDTGFHPESSERLIHILNHIKETGLSEQVEFIDPRLATEKEVDIIHSDTYIRYVKETCESGGGYLDIDTYVSPLSFQASLRAVGVLLDAVDLLMTEKLKSVF